MKKLALVLVLLVALLAVSCENDVLKNLMLTDSITLSLTQKDDYYNASYTGDGPATTDVLDCVELQVPSNRQYPNMEIRLLENSLGSYSGKAKKVVIPKEVTFLCAGCISDAVVTEIDIQSDLTDYLDYGFSGSAFSGCTSLEKVLFNGEEVDVSEFK